MVWQPPEDDDKPDLTPMIDVVFLLIVFFMVAAVLITQNKAEVVLPVATASQVAEDIMDRMTLSMDIEGTTYVGVRPIPMEDIVRDAREGAEANPLFEVFLRIDEGTPHRHVEDLLSSFAENGVFNVIFATYES